MALREHTRAADSKAQLLGSVLIPSIVGAVATGVFAHLPAIAAITAWPAAGFSLAAIAILGGVVWPQPPGQLGIGDVEATLTTARRKATAPKWRLTALAAEHNHLARIVAAKWRRLKWALRMTGGALALGTATVILAVLN
ncbi:hypothetical protein [Glycomyces buryatensis]|uniref:Pycsar effector protein domain-containing protein n=1 Tax=Glycomyces buryatensis TaxID=2570927 RepID=A0A4S8Q860_9ACTN|nr:hypothetical protein [Glycomyces buryatensis]THV40567.1 hypothetical protein FAB82_14975 [Glycomyces buryatensis]